MFFGGFWTGNRNLVFVPVQPLLMFDGCSWKELRMCREQSADRLQPVRGAETPQAALDSSATPLLMCREMPTCACAYSGLPRSAAKHAGVPR